MRKLLLLLYAIGYLSLLLAQETALLDLKGLSHSSTFKEKIAVRNQIVKNLEQQTTLSKKLQAALAYQQAAEISQDSIFLSSSYAQLQAIYLALEDESKHRFYATKQKNIDASYGFLLSDLSNNYQFLYTPIKVLAEKEKSWDITTIRSKDSLFTINNTATNFQAKQTYWAKLILRNTEDTTQKGLLFIEGNRNSYRPYYCLLFTQISHCFNVNLTSL